MAIYLGNLELATGGGGGGGGGFTKEYNLRGNTQQGRIYPVSYTAGVSEVWVDTANATALAIGTKCTIWFNYPATDGPYIVQKTRNEGGNYNVFDFVGTPPSTSYANNTPVICNINTDVVVNPAVNLGLEDGAQIGYFIIGGGASGYNTTIPTDVTQQGGAGGRYRSGILNIVTASTDLVLTCGNAGGINITNNDSQIVYGSTTISTSGYPYGWGAMILLRSNNINGKNVGAAWSGINGYGMGGSANNFGGAISSNDGFQGYGTGGTFTNSASFIQHRGGAGSVLLYY